jgi:IS30 family transposase
VIDLDVARDLVTSNAIKKLKQGNPAANLLTTREIAKLTNRTVSTIDSYVRRFGLKKYYIHEHTTHYLIDGEELADRMEEAGLPLT